MSGETRGAKSPGTIFVVDRKEGRTCVVVDDAGRSFDVEAALLPRECRTEGAVMRVTMGAGGAPQWKTAVRDNAEERRRREDAQNRLDRLKRSDPGGDVSL